MQKGIAKICGRKFCAFGGPKGRRLRGGERATRSINLICPLLAKQQPFFSSIYDARPGVLRIVPRSFSPEKCSKVPRTVRVGSREFLASNSRSRNTRATRCKRFTRTLVVGKGCRFLATARSKVCVRITYVWSINARGGAVTRQFWLPIIQIKIRNSQRDRITVTGSWIFRIRIHYTSYLQISSLDLNTSIPRSLSLYRGFLGPLNDVGITSEAN